MSRVYKRQYYCLIPSCEMFSDRGCDYCINNCEALYVKRPIDSVIERERSREQPPETYYIDVGIEKLHPLLRAHLTPGKWTPIRAGLKIIKHIDGTRDILAAKIRVGDNFDQTIQATED